MKKFAIIIPASLVALVYVFAIWNASRSLELADTLEARTSAAADAHADWTTPRDWATDTTRDCHAIEELVGEGGSGASDGSMGLVRLALLDGEPVPDVLEGGFERPRRRAEVAAACRVVGSVDVIRPGRVEMFAWSQHLDTVTLLAADAARADADTCVERAALLVEFGYDAASAGSLEGLSHATVELELADAVLSRCAPRASDSALGGVIERLRELSLAELPIWRSLVGQSLLVEAGSKAATGDIHVFPTDPIELKRAIFTAKLLRGWGRAIEGRERAGQVARDDSVLDAAAYWEEMFEDDDDAFEHVLVARPSHRISAFENARARLNERRAEMAVLVGERAYAAHRAGSMLDVFEHRYAVE